MIHLTDEMRESVNGARASGNPCIVATASPDGTPNAGFIGTVMAYDEVSLAYRDRSGRRPLDHIETDPKVVVLFRDSGRESVGSFAAPRQCIETVRFTTR